MASRKAKQANAAERPLATRCHPLTPSPYMIWDRPNVQMLFPLIILLSTYLSSEDAAWVGVVQCPGQLLQQAKVETSTGSKPLMTLYNISTDDQVKTHSEATMSQAAFGQGRPDHNAITLRTQPYGVPQWALKPYPSIQCTCDN
jgi:hypothetical protein